MLTSDYIGMSRQPLRATRSGVTFSPWDLIVPIHTPAHFDFEHLVQEGSQTECMDDSDGSDLDAFGLSPLTSPDPSPPPSPIPPLEQLPTHLDLPLGIERTSSPSHCPTPAPRKVNKRKRSKNKGHANRRAKRARVQAGQRLEDYGVRPEASAKYVGKSKEAHCTFDGNRLQIASTGYVGIRGGRTATVYRLDQVTGAGSTYGFELHKWDGKYVFTSASSLLGSAFQNPNAHSRHSRTHYRRARRPPGGHHLGPGCHGCCKSTRGGTRSL